MALIVFSHANSFGASTYRVLFRLLRHTYGADAVIYAANVTDVDDKTIRGARAAGRRLAGVPWRHDSNPTRASRQWPV